MDLISFIKTFAEVVIILALLRLIQAWAANRYGPNNSFVRALAFID